MIPGARITFFLSRSVVIDIPNKSSEGTNIVEYVEYVEYVCVYLPELVNLDGVNREEEKNGERYFI